ncbi:hypothetical protein [Hydrogenophaga sp.]
MCTGASSSARSHRHVPCLWALSVAADGALYVADTTNHKIRKVVPVQ